MDSEEKAVINEFQGEAAYAGVVANAGFYLADVSTTLLQVEQQPAGL